MRQTEKRGLKSKRIESNRILNVVRVRMIERGRESEIKGEGERG